MGVDGQSAGTGSVTTTGNANDDTVTLEGTVPHSSNSGSIEFDFLGGGTSWYCWELESLDVWIDDPEEDDSPEGPPDEDDCDTCSVENAPGSDGGDPQANGETDDPIRYFDGTVKLGFKDLESGGFGTPWGMTRTWTNNSQYSRGDLAGSGMNASELPYLYRTNDGDTIVAVTNGSSARVFDYDGSGWVVRHFGNETFTHDEAGQRFTMTDSAGNGFVFSDFSSTLARPQRGSLEKFVDQGGNEITVTSRDAAGRPTEVRRSSGTGASAVVESMVYTYNSDSLQNGNANLLASVLLQRQVGGGAWQAVRGVEYAYYQHDRYQDYEFGEYDADPYGDTGDLKTATVRDYLKDPSGATVDVHYYRYYNESSPRGYHRGLQYYFGPESYARLAAAVSNPLTAGENAVKAYADNYFEYDAERRVTKEVAQGAGSSQNAGGLGAFTYAYSTSTNAKDYNQWKYKTVEGLPDGNTRTVYANGYGEVMLKVFIEAATGKQFIDFWRYDDEGRILLRANPSAISGFAESSPDLVKFVSNDGDGTPGYEYLRNDAGLIDVSDYYASTSGDLSETVKGGVEGYLKERSVKRGENGIPVKQFTQDYVRRVDAGGANTFPVASQTAYRNANGTGGLTTSYAYDWHGATSQVKTRTATDPTVTAAQNGPGTATSAVEVFDAYGRSVWSRDEDGYLTYRGYDQGSGALKTLIADADPAQVFSPAVAGPGRGASLPSPLHLVTSMEVDGLGRTTKLTDPNGNVTYTVFNEAQQEMRVYRGWNAATNLPTTPIEITRQVRGATADADGDGQVYTEVLTTSAVPTVDAAGRPTGNEVVNASNLQSLTRHLTNKSGQVVKADAYFSFAGITYSLVGPSLGSPSNDSSLGNYHRTRIDYDGRGRLERVEDATGTVTRTVYDGLGRVVGTWAGTDDVDSGGTVYWSPATAANAEFNLVKTAAYEYDRGSAGDGTLTRMTELPGGGAAPRVTEMAYDWRDRRVATKAGSGVTLAGESADTQRQITWSALDNLGRAVATNAYDGDGLNLYADANADGIPDAPAAGKLRARSTTDYDDRGRVYRSSTFSVAPITGAVGSALYSDAWYDRRGHVAKTAAPGGLVTKTRYDGAGRPTAVFATDGGGDAEWADALNVAGDAVLEQRETQYDKAGNATLSTTRQRFHDEAATGALGTATSGVKARVSYAATFYDRADRPTGTVDVGTNGGAAYTRPSALPSRSDAALVTTYAYDAAGRLRTTLDPRGIATTTDYDLLGRTTRVTEADADPLLADSRAQFSGTQGRDGWSYGWYNDNTAYDTSFNQATFAQNGFYDASAGKWITNATYAAPTYGSAYHTADSMQPMIATNNPAVRRWTASAGGTLKVQVVAKRNDASSSGNGVWVNIVFRNNVIDRRHISNTNTSTTTFDVTLAGVLPGEAIDVVVHPINGALYDDTAVTATVTGAGSAADERVTIYSHDGIGGVRSMRALLPGGAFQETRYLYESRRSTGSGADRNDVLSAVRYPDPATGVASAAQQETFAVNALGERTGYADRNGTAHAYGRDVLGRTTSDAVTALGAGVDGATRRIGTSYDTQGLPARLTSYADAAGTAVVNEVLRSYNGLGQLAAEYQSHAGDVDLAATPKVQYAHSEMSGGANHSRPTGMTYPDGRVLTYNYANGTGAAGVDDRISRLSSTSDASGLIESYSYLGLGTVVGRGRGNGVGLTYIGTGAGDGGDQYVGLDRFGRVADQRWTNGAGADADRFAYGHDRNGNRLFRDNRVNAAFGEVYHGGAGYDALGRLTAFERGTLNAAKTDTIAPSRGQSWALDALGNMAAVTTDGAAEARTHDGQNRLTAVGGTGLTHSPNGEMTVDEQGQTLVYDGWGRLASVGAVEYAHDALGRRVLENGIHLYYSEGWQVLEERDAAGAIKAQYVWSPVYVDALVLRDRDADGSAANGAEERRYALHDANYNVTALTDAAGVVVERYVYDPYGARTVLTAAWQPRAAADAVGLLYGHQGGRLDPATGLYHFRNRDYDPVLGRWTRQDPVGYPDGASRYQAYVSHPIGRLDPQGTNVRVDNTTGVYGLHQRICVDTYDDSCNKTGQYCISFGTIQGGSHPRWSGGASSGQGGSSDSDSRGEGASSSADEGANGGPVALPSGNANPNGDGQVYDDGWSESTGKERELATSCAADKNIKAYLESLVGTRGDYNIFTSSCRDFSDSTFEHVKNNYSDFLP